MWWKRGKKNLDERIDRLYRKFSGTAARFGFAFNRPSVSVGGKPNVLLLGSHSAGKSSWINHLLGGEPVQATGVAPTDDGFTVIQEGPDEIEHQGAAALADLPSDFAGLDRLGDEFLAHLKTKSRRNPLLKSVNLIDSPGMIDSAQPEARRDYDFVAAIRRMAERADLILFLFDPDKPGTTAESLTVLREALGDMAFKIRFLMNKADTFENMQDFARAYGALCWNLGRVLPGKDLPMIFTTYVPADDGRVGHGVDLKDFDDCREELIRQIRQAADRRADNLMAQVRRDLMRLILHVRVAVRVRRRLAALRLRQALASVVWVWLVAGAVYLAAGRMQSPAWLQGLLTVAGGSATGLLCAWAARRGYRIARLGLLESLDEVMREVFVRVLATERRDDIESCWQETRANTRQVISRIGERLPLRAGPLPDVLERWMESGSWDKHPHI